jgi:geranylgeranyl reductase family protein
VLETEVAVVGGGPAGSAAAITLARAGQQVVLFDKATFPRDKVCGDGLTASALRSLEALGLDPTMVTSWRSTDDIVIRSPSGCERRFALPLGEGVFAAAARRADLDAAVLDLARGAGADVRDGAGVSATRISADGEVVELEVDGIGPVRASYVIAADGMWSSVRHHLGLAVDGYRGDAHAFRQYFTSVGPRAEKELYVAFEPDLLPGYFWSFPLPGGGANVGFGIHRGAGYTVRQMAAVWPELLARPHIRAFLGGEAVAEGPHRSWPIPARVGGLPLTGGNGRVLFVGDAAAAVDAMSGEGIGQALQTGQWAAEAIVLAGRRRSGVAARRYETLVQRELVPDHRMSMALVRLLGSERGANFAVRTAGLTAWTRRNFARWLFEDEPRGALLTPSRWRGDFLARHGAYAEVR